ncbi:hypothetical protein [Micromonospora sp. RTGN7]|uniref:hypothetical protein n=1 Tax=Micromonospora sp. RTGN7 TaxID=3016526 RepID=UPI0029FEFAE8|nr:hypothetical protein [Micromonospora sp. RTGN7]
MTYYAIFRAAEKGEAAGLLLMDVDSGDALIWNNRLQEWTYDPGLAVRFLDDHRNFSRYREVEAAEARRIAERVTGGALPGEAEVVNIFRQGNSRE